MNGVYSMLWRCPRCKKVNGYTTRKKRPKKRIDTNCGYCMYRVRFTPVRRDIWSKSYGSQGRGRKSTVSDYRILSKWYSQHDVSLMANSFNQNYLETFLEINQSRKQNDPLYSPFEFSTYSIQDKTWRKSE